MKADSSIGRRRRLRIFWIAALCVSAGIVVLLATLSSLMEDRVRLSLQVRADISDYYLAIAEAEKAQRAYIFIQDADYLTDYRYALSRIEEIGAKLQAVVATNALQAEGIGKILRLTEERNAQFEKTLETFERQGFEAAVEAVRLNEVRQTTRRIHDLVDSIEEEENRILALRQARVEVLRVLLLFALLGMLAGTLAMSSTSLEGERRAAEKLAELNRTLEARVSERTEELERERRRIEYLMADLSHRIGNNLSILSSSLLMQARRTDDEGVRDALEDAHERIVAVAAAQRRLYVNSATATVNVRDYLASLLSDLRRTIAPEGVAIAVKADPVEMRGDDAVALGIIVNELVTNALKHAFPDGRGRIDVRLSARGDDAVLEVADNGRGFEDGRSPGVGSLVVQSMVNALKGRAASTVSDAEGPRPGTRWHVRFPLRGAAEARPGTAV